MSSPEEVTQKIVQGKKLLLAGDERLLERLPPGDWIGGTIAYFMTEEGGMCTREKIHVTELPPFVSGVEIRCYDEESIGGIYQDAPKNGFSVIIIPARSRMHFSFALNAPGYEGFAMHPLIGWISGVHLDDLGTAAPKVFDGRRGAALAEGAIVMHVPLPTNKYADIGIINIFEQGDGDTLEFPDDGFRVEEALVNGKKKNFGHHIFANGFDKRLPLVADYHGLLINTSFCEGEEMEPEVEFYGPVFSGLQYKHARPVEDYVSRFVAQLPDGIGHQILFSCNCILNYLYSELHGKKIAGITGPTTFGEIAYLLLNQTMVYLRIIDLPDAARVLKGAVRG
jgi:hypothetical protein